MSDEKHYDKDGKYSGHTSTDGPGHEERHYDKDGKYSGYSSSDGPGHIRIHYDEDGNYAGSSGSGDGCFISTACIEAKGLPDDCLELQILRNFRENYIKKLPDGNAMLSNYYRLAPKIIKSISSRKNESVYSDLYKRLILDTIDLIEQRKDKAAFENLRNICEKLVDEYL